MRVEGWECGGCWAVWSGVVEGELMDEVLG